ncbi:LysR family transcriptional regulator [Aeromonas sanarellii]|uniref:LysR family transcriptional regulator n=1 Tax=Aeromonas TaxID=642 RepID=UPI002DBF59D8|nr:LysR family transcriptional regulator [Aeromonas sanarellii]MEB6608071.1 LysR family transcriptional regulator [Aeromonas sanarellii]
MLDRIRILAQVVESGSFSRAARALNLAPSSVTRAIDALEQQLGIPLFKRSTRQLVLTSQGEYFLARSLPLLEEADQLVQSLQPLSVAPQGPLRVSVFESFAAAWLAPRLPDFLARYPGVRLEIELDNRLVDLDAENVDVAVRIGRPVDSGLHARHLLTNRALLVASPAYLARHGEPAHPADLAHHNCLIRGHGRQRQHWHFRRGTERHRVAVQGNLASVGGTPLLCAARAGCGILLLSSWMVQQSLDDGTLVSLLPEWQASPYEDRHDEIHAVFRGGRFLTPQARAFIDFLVEAMAPLQGPR